MNLQEMMNQISSLGFQIRSKANALSAMAGGSATMDQLNAAQAEIEELRGKQKALMTAYEIERQAQAGQVQPMGAPAEQPKNVRDMLKSNEYARAFAFALKNGINPRNAAAYGGEKVKILMDALTEGGGDPVGEDGGFLVPEDIDHAIREQRRELKPLADLFEQEEVTAPTGWRVTDTQPTKGLVDVDEMGSISTTDDQPVFAKVPYSCSKKALILPVSNELMSDNVANLFSYIGRWFAKKLVISENALLIAALRTLVATSITANKELEALKKAKNVTLDPAISSLSTWIMNQTAFDVLDNLLDNNDRPLLQPNPTEETDSRLLRRNVFQVSDAHLGAPTTNKSDIFLGYGKEFATLFRVQGFQLASTTIGGDAWRKDSTEIRGITRLGVSKFDAAAMCRLQLSLA